MKNMLLAGNWKMNTLAPESAALVMDILERISKLSITKSKILVCPPFTSLEAVYDVIKDSQIFLGAQNCHFEPKGAFTGEISISMLKQAGCSHVIVGHSERRTYFAETDEMINKKLKALTNHAMVPVFCIGETLAERQRSETFSVLRRQLDIGLLELESSGFVVAYEPVWAIGTGISATDDQVNEAHTWIRNYLIEKYGDNGADIHILYGGSLNDKNAESILGIADVNGGLIGGASLNAESFVKIIETGESLV